MKATDARDLTLRSLKRAGIVLTEAERKAIEVVDFGLGELETTGLQLVTYVNTERAGAHPPAARSDTYTVFHEVRLRPGEQYTLMPNVLHWFQAGDEGAVVSEFSTRSRDEHDVFTDPEIDREPLA